MKIFNKSVPVPVLIIFLGWLALIFQVFFFTLGMRIVTDWEIRFLLSMGIDPKVFWWIFIFLVVVISPFFLKYYNDIEKKK